MHKTEGMVVRIDGDFAYIQAKRQSSCGGCAREGGSCGTSALIGFFDKKTPLYRARNDLGVKAGDRVVIGMSEDAFFKGAMVLYLPPLLLLLVGAIGGNMMAPTPVAGEGYSIAGAALGVVAGFFWSRFHSKRMAADMYYQPEILGVVNFQARR